MIARIRYPMNGLMVEAVLQDNGKWLAPSEEVTAVLNNMFAPGRTGPWGGIPGHAEVYAAAQYLNGIIDVPPAQVTPAATTIIY